MGRLKLVLIIAFAALAWVSGSQAQAAEAAMDTVVYYRKARGFWHVRLRTDVSGSGMTYLGTLQNGELLYIDTKSDTRIRQNIGLGIGPVLLNAGFSLNGKKQDGELAITTFGKYLSLYLGYSYSNSMSGSGSINQGDPLAIPAGSLFNNALQARLFYAVNGKRFSFPAAMTQATIQEHSAGSILLSVNAMAMGALSDADSNWPLPDLNLDNFTFGLGIGYGYNLVPFERMLIHASLIASPSLLNRTRLGIGGPQESLRGSATMSVVGNFAVVYHFEKKYYVGAFASANDIIAIGGGSSNCVFEHMKSDAHIAVGVRF